LECPTLADRLDIVELRFAFRGGDLVKIVERIQELRQADAEATATVVLDELDDAALKSRLLSAVMSTPRDAAVDEALLARELDDCVLRIRSDALKIEGAALRQAIADAEAKGDAGAVRRLLTQKAEVAKRLSNTHHVSSGGSFRGKLKRGNA
jgi:hypothetical protein